jgi:putative CocE/NonD family hydrolase
MRTILSLVVLLWSGASLAQQLDVATLYDKQEVMVPMRDGVRLFTSIYTPKDKSKPSGVIFTRTPYSCAPYGPSAYRPRLGASQDYMKENFIFVFQDVRGRYMSEGNFADIRPQNPNKRGPKDIDESTDTYDSIEWLVKNVPNNNGRVGLIGISYPGFYAAVGAVDSHPALKCSSPQAPVSEWFMGDDFHHNGAFFLLDCFNFYNGFGRPRPVPSKSYPPGYRHNSQDAYKFFLDIGPIRNIDEKIFKGDVKFWTELMQHPNYDPWWQSRSLPNHMKNVKCAVMTVGGWFDAEDLYGALHIYKGTERLNPGIENGIVMGPWTHGMWAGGGGDRLGDQEFGSRTAPEYQATVELPFFRKYLKGEGDFKLEEARIFETGSNRWNVFSAWPPKQAQRSMLYFQAGDALGGEKPKTSGLAEYVSDPARPVPYVDGTTYRRPSEYMNADQRFAWRRPDVLTFRSEPLTEPLRLAGPVNAKLFVSMTGTDADFVVKLIDEFPADAPSSSEGPPMAGYQMMVRGEIMRGRFRNSFERPEAFVPGRVTPVNFYVPDVCHTFKPGHRVVVQVQSSWFPLADRNPQSFVDIYKAREQDFKKATIRVHHSPEHPSGIEVGVMK